MVSGALLLGLVEISWRHLKSFSLRQGGRSGGERQAEVRLLGRLMRVFSAPGWCWTLGPGREDGERQWSGQLMRECGDLLGRVFVSSRSRLSSIDISAYKHKYVGPLKTPKEGQGSERSGGRSGSSAGGTSQATEICSGAVFLPREKMAMHWNDFRGH